MHTSWRVVYWGQNGKEYLSVQADTRETVLTTVGVDTSRIISIRREWISWRLVRAFFLRPKDKQQLSILLNIQATCLTGNSDQTRLFMRNHKIFKTLVKSNASVFDDLEVSQCLRHLQFNPEICAAVANGERVGDLSSGIGEAIRHLQSTMDLQNKNSHQLILGMVMLIISFGIVFFFLPTLHDIIQPLMSIEGIGFSKTFATDLLINISQFVIAYRIWLILGIVVLIFLGVFYYPYIKHIPPFFLINDLKNTQRSIKFLTTWTLYRSSGMSLENDKPVLCQILGYEIGNEVFQKLEYGEAMDEVISTHYFSPILSGAMSALCQFQGSKIKEISDLLVANLLTEQQQKSKAIAGTFYGIATAIGLSMVLLLAYGLIFPMFGTITEFGT